MLVLKKKANSVSSRLSEREKILITRDIFYNAFLCVEHGVGYIKLGASL